MIRGAGDGRFMLPVRRANAGAGRLPHVSLGPPRAGRNLSQLTMHGRLGQTPLQYAVTKMGGLITQRTPAMERASPPDHAVSEGSLRDHVLAILGAEHDAARIHPDLWPYLNELSKNESTFWAHPVTQSSFTLLCILYMADQVPGPAAYGRFSRDAFMGWLNQQLAPGTAPGTAVPYDCIPDRYFETVRVKRNPVTGFANRCAVQYSRDAANSVDVRAMHPANLQYANLRDALLEGVDLRDAYLRGADLRGADLRGTDLRGANLEGANLEGANLEEAKLNGANLERASLKGAYLRKATLVTARLEGADLQGANLRGADLVHAGLGGANLRGADLQDARLAWVYLRGGVDLGYANLRGTCLYHVDLQGANLEGADLQDADLGGAYLDGADLRGVVNLTVTPHLAWKIVFSRTPPNLAGATLVMSAEEAASSWQEYVAERMAYWDGELFDLNLNHRNNTGRSVLKNIAGLDDRWRDTKQALMRAVVGELDLARKTPQARAINDLIPSLGDVLFDDPEYLSGQDNFSAWLCDGLLGNGSTLLDTRLSDAALEALGGYAARLLETKDIETIAGHSVPIYQLLYAMRERAGPPASLEVREKWTEQSRPLHEQYRKVLEDAHPTLMGEGGVFKNERDDILMEDDAFPLISADGRSCVIMTDQYYRQLVLGVRFRGEMNCAWADLRCVAAAGTGSNCTFPASVNDPGDRSQGGTRGTASTDAIIEQFPLLRAASGRENAAATHDRMLALAGLTGALQERFTAALKDRDTHDKMTDNADQIELGKIFEAAYEDSKGQGVHLRPAHFEVLKAQWEDDSDKAFAFRLLCMAALYTYYASSHIFGKEYESPNALRIYAEALLRKVHELDAGLLGNRLADWVKRLKGQDGAFTCTSILYSLQSMHMANILKQEVGDNKPLHQVWDAMIPVAWR